MKVLVGIPWRSQSHRVYAHEIATEHYRTLLPEADVINVDTQHDTFCLAACRNQVARIAEDRTADVAVLADADTLAEQKPLLAAIKDAQTSGLVHLPYTEYRSLRKNGTEQLRSGRALEDCDHLVVEGACSGIYVTTPATWWAHGGQDEHFLDWGFEDAAWMAAHKTLLGAEPIRHPGRVFSLHHESQAKEGKQYSANAARCFRYHQAQGDPDAMRALIAEQSTETLPA